MISQPSAFRSLSPRQEDLRQRLLGAVARRDAVAVAPLSWQWVHRQGVEALDSLVVSLADPEAAGWWRQQLVAGPVALGAQESQGPVVAVMALDPAAPAAPVILESAELEPEDESLLPTAADSSSDFWLSEGPEVEEVPLADFVALGGTPVAGDLAHGRSTRGR
ncbi:hypothetical protein [Cyanobium sp. ATX-6F1]|uniref:hypothetical protein n=1 Tax=Cyanobium sp. ATX-6F1 TaxID=3137388 RepID=UPI0039BE0F26